MPKKEKSDTDLLKEAFDSLSPREIEIFYYRFIIGLSLREVGEEFCVNKERIRQLEAKIAAKIYGVFYNEIKKYNKSLIKALKNF